MYICNKKLIHLACKGIAIDMNTYKILDDARSSPRSTPNPHEHALDWKPPVALICAINLMQFSREICRKDNQFFSETISLFVGIICLLAIYTMLIYMNYVHTYIGHTIYLVRTSEMFISTRVAALLGRVGRFGKSCLRLGWTCIRQRGNYSYLIISPSTRLGSTSSKLLNFVLSKSYHCSKSFVCCSNDSIELIKLPVGKFVTSRLELRSHTN